MSSTDARWYWLANKDTRSQGTVLHLVPRWTRGSYCGLWGPWSKHGFSFYADYERMCGTCARIYSKRVIGRHIGEEPDGER